MTDLRKQSTLRNIFKIELLVFKGRVYKKCLYCKFILCTEWAAVFSDPVTVKV